MTELQQIMTEDTVCTNRETNEELCVRIQHGDQKAKNLLLERNAGLIHAIAWRERRKYTYLMVELEDLWAAGQMGMLHAAELFQEESGNSFVTYAWSHVRQSIQREIVRGGTMIRIPVHLHERMHKISVYRESFSNVDYRGLAQRITKGEREGYGLTEREVRDCLSQTEPALSVRSLNDPLSQDGTLEREETICDSEIPTPDQIVEVRWMVSACLACLTPREREVIEMRYGLDGAPERTLLEIGTLLEISKERVRQLEQRAMQKMRTWVART